MDLSASGIGRYPLWQHDDHSVSEEDRATPIDTGAMSTMSASILGSCVRQMLDPKSASEVDEVIAKLTRISSKYGARW